MHLPVLGVLFPVLKERKRRFPANSVNVFHTISEGGKKLELTVRTQ
jgi:hypothetical protein